MEGYFSQIDGILDTSVGYANGQVETTNYQLLKQTDHAETLYLAYDETRIHLREILLYYFRVIDPFSVNQQGLTRGASIGRVSITQMRLICRPSSRS